MIKILNWIENKSLKSNLWFNSNLWWKITSPIRIRKKNTSRRERRERTTDGLTDRPTATEWGMIRNERPCPQCPCIYKQARSHGRWNTSRRPVSVVGKEDALPMAGLWKRLSFPHNHYNEYWRHNKLSEPPLFVSTILFTCAVRVFR